MQTRQLGILLVLVSAVLWSTAGIFVRMAEELDIWSIVGWRSFFSLLTLGLYLVWRNRVEPDASRAAFGWVGVFSSVISVVAAIAYVASLRLTSVANVMTVYAALPFIATAIAWLFLRERVSLRFIIAGLIAAAGITLMVGAAVTGRDMLGIFAGFVMTSGFAAQLVIAKKYPDLDMTLMAVWSSAGCTLLSLPFMSHALPSIEALAACALYGSLTTGLAYVIVLIGGRMIGSGEAGFLSLLDVVLGPLWVWLLFDERVAPSVLLGGGIVLGSVVWYLATQRDTLPATPSASS